MKSILVLFLLIITAFSIIIPSIILRYYSFKNKIKFIIILISLIILYILSSAFLILAPEITSLNFVRGFYSFVELMSRYMFILWSLILILYTFYYHYNNEFLKEKKHVWGNALLGIFFVLISFIFLVIVSGTFSLGISAILNLFVPIFLLLLPSIFISFKEKRLSKFLKKALLIVIVSVIIILLFIFLVSQNKDNCRVDSDCVPFRTSCCYDCNPYPDLVNKKYVPLLSMSQFFECIGTGTCTIVSCMRWGLGMEPHCNQNNKCEYRYTCDNCDKIKLILQTTDCDKMKSLLQTTDIDFFMENFYEIELFVKNKDYFLDECDCYEDFCDFICPTLSLLEEDIQANKFQYFMPPSKNLGKDLEKLENDLENYKNYYVCEC